MATADGQAPPLPRRWVRSLVTVAVVTALAYASFAAFSDLQGVLDRLQGFPWPLLVPVLGLVACGYGFRIIRWHLYLAHLGRPLSPTGSALTFLSGFAMGITPGKVGEAVKGYYVRLLAGTPYPVSIAAVVAERAMDALIMAILLALGWAWAGLQPLWAGALVPLAILALVLVVRNERALASVLALLRRVPVIARIVSPLRETHASLRPLLDGPRLLMGGALGLASWAMEPIAMWALARGLGLDLSLAVCTFVFAAASVAGVLTFLPGGLGATEGGMIALLLAFGTGLAGATALTMLIRLCTLWFGVALGALSIPALRTLPTRTRPAHAVS